MTVTKYNFKTVITMTGLPDYTVRYRVDKLGLGEKVGERFFLYTDNDVRKIKDYSEPKD